MMGDRDKCLEAGANDYVAKPVNIDVLLSILWRTLPQNSLHG
jgi:CheY-like chemotaxis protein